MLTENHQTYGLSQRDLDSIFTILMKYPEVKELRIFGSRAKGTAKPGSDIDLAIMNEGISTSTLLQLKADFEDSTLPYKVDLIYYPDLKHKELKEHILGVGRRFYEWIE